MWSGADKTNLGISNVVCRFVLNLSINLFNCNYLWVALYRGC